ncbi:MAG: hypothetical protein E7B13_06680 [Clostridium sp.]|uniref:ATP-binding protein n=1 Tax=Clostridium sp. TaxID=1506 RepID=UPI0029036670|nr:hypothetical protein [Clostridium sp.]MDU3089107.1 hypothetical protein [Clostridium sp.]
MIQIEDLEKIIKIVEKHDISHLIGDNYGNVVYLGERECTIQRRHQKLLNIIVWEL